MESKYLYFHNLNIFEKSKWAQLTRDAFRTVLAWPAKVSTASIASVLVWVRPDGTMELAVRFLMTSGSSSVIFIRLKILISDLKDNTQYYQSSCASSIECLTNLVCTNNLCSCATNQFWNGTYCGKSDMFNRLFKSINFRPIWKVSDPHDLSLIEYFNDSTTI